MSYRRATAVARCADEPPQWHVGFALGSFLSAACTPAHFTVCPSVVRQVGARRRRARVATAPAPGGVAALPHTPEQRSAHALDIEA